MEYRGEGAAGFPQPEDCSKRTSEGQAGVGFRGWCRTKEPQKEGLGGPEGPNCGALGRKSKMTAGQSRENI